MRSWRYRSSRDQLLAANLRTVARIHDHERLEVQDALEVAQGDVEDVADAGKADP